MRVYVAATPARLAALRAQGLPAGTEGYAATPGLAEALGLPVDGGEDTAEELGEAVIEAAAEASLLLLAQEPGAGEIDVAVGAQTLAFVPGAIRAGDYAFAIGTAGSSSLATSSTITR